MYYFPLIRANRAISACLIYPNHPIASIAASEVISVLVPIFNSRNYAIVLGLFLSFLHSPEFFDFYLDYYEKKELTYFQFELCTSLLFILAYSLKFIG